MSDCYENKSYRNFSILTSSSRNLYTKEGYSKHILLRLIINKLEKPNTHSL